MCEEYMNITGKYTAHDIVDYACDALDGCNMRYADELMAEACAIANLWVGDTLEEICEEADMFVETLCGYLAEYLAD